MLNTKCVLSLLLSFIAYWLTQGVFAFEVEQLVFSRDKTQLVYVVGQDIVKMSTATGKVIKKTPFTLAHNATLFAPTVDGLKLLSVHEKGIDVIHNGLGKLLRTLPHPTGKYAWQNQPVQQNASGTLLAIPVLQQTLPQIYLIHTGTGKLIRRLAVVEKGELWNETGKVGAIGFSPDKRLLAYTRYMANKAILQLYDINQQKKLFSVAINIAIAGNKQVIHFSRDGKRLLISSPQASSMQLVDLQQQMVTNLNHTGCSFAGFSADDKHVLCFQSAKKQILVYVLATGKVQRQSLPAVTQELGGYKHAVQSADRTLLALALNAKQQENVNHFLLIDGNTGRFIRHLTH
ncbi:MAG TPA: hypothetical protein ENJ33_02350 [Thiothrix sp.]|nr:hypothetical protein [Thiothrix sp.]